MMRVDDNVTISYGDRHYGVSMYGGDTMEHVKYKILAMMHKALVAFHGPEGDAYREAELKSKLYTLANQRPDLIEELKVRELI